MIEFDYKIDYKNIKLLKKYVSDTNKILPSRITSVSQGKQRKLNNEIKKAKILGLLLNAINFIRKYYQTWKNWGSS